MKSDNVLMPKKSNWRTLFIWIIIIVLIWIISIFVIKYYFDKSDDAGLFGDSFGAVNSLFSGLAFAGIIYTILLQREELKLQRMELKQTREELAKSANAQDKSQRALSKQIDAMNLSAKLNGVATLLEFYNTQAVNLGPGNHKDNVMKLAEEYEKQLKKVMQEIDTNSMSEFKNAIRNQQHNLKDDELGN